MCEILLCQNEVDLALKNLHTWTKDKPVAKNLVSSAGRGRSPGPLSPGPGCPLSPHGDSTALKEA